MNRLQRELQRLYAPQADAKGRVRAMVLELARPADWAALSAVWGGAQADLGLPAPAIAVNGSDGFQLWFSLSQPVPAPQASAFLDGLRRRYLGEIAPARVALLPAADVALDVALDFSPMGPPLHARSVPALQANSGRWSAFVASDLVPMFADEPWLDMPPNPDGQAQLLEPLKSFGPAEFELALQRLRPAAPAPNAAELAAASLDPKRFLLDVMNNDSLDLALRIEAAKALLPYFESTRDPRQQPAATATSPAP